MVREIGFLVFDGVKLLDVAGPAEVFAEAGLSGAAYRVRLVSPDGADVRSSIGMRVPVDGAPADLGPLDTALVAGGEVFPATPVSPELVAAARALAAASTRLASICTGAFVLGAAGLLDGKRATTHWKHTRALATRHPATRVQPDAIFVRDGRTYTSAGVTAGIDLALALLEADHGPDLARAVAKSLVVYMQRAGGQSQFSAALLAPSPRTPVLKLVTDAVQADPAAAFPLDRLAELANLSPRHLTRLFREELGTTPAKYVELVRFDLAKALLDAGHSVTRTAQLAGYGTPEALRRVFVARLSLSPSRYQRRFLSTGGQPRQPDTA
ncbi:transcriptional regulator GlxA family with amidase domain [Crossiella equi]|uniref:Transcriptional regulator GlxA family with amidase domain n=1 Tax=Crossiella equi TaxID=130796 RepID=A0ABS5AQ37_9PSEU|nr:GlxA family transcriptional regulator [Crossiella equi]MBP2478683.1 transcriptional regulator GlxA family with amidase domain [Crossiella equi]